MNPNLLIEASAGTGKTQALAVRLIALLRAGVRPQDIVALTFSRAAAGEIFERFVTLLADGAAANPADARLLRDVLATQHLSQIGTLDSFLMRIVRSFPLELGLAGDLEIMDGYREAVECARTSFAILRRTDAQTKAAFADAFARAMDREDVRSFVAAYRDFIRAWHEQVLARPAPSAWGDPAAIWGAPPAGLGAGRAELAAAADRVAAEAGGEKPLADFADWVRGFRGSFAGVKGLAKKLLETDGVLDRPAFALKFNRKEYAFSGVRAAAVQDALRAVFGLVLGRCLARARGVYGLISAYEAAYARNVRDKGKLVFADIPRLIARLGPDARLALEYRLDAKIAAWALDEFQDTSREQWRALAPLVEEAKQSAGERSVFVVGDRKQAIYGWRNGDVGIFTRERESGAYALDELRKTYRSGPAVVEAVNRVFVDGPLKSEFPPWSAPVHETARPDLGGFVQTVPARGARQEDFTEPVANALLAVDPVKRGISAAVLVRKNDFGKLLAARLKQRGVADVVWEGESPVCDTPALTGFLDLVALADHPGDTQAYRHFRATPLAAAAFPEGVPPADEVSQKAARAFTVQGLVRTFRDLRARLPEDPDSAWSAFTEDRFTDMLRAAAAFESAREPGTRLSDFARFLASRSKRSVAAPGKIRIMTIHHSKGLGFDYVILPLYEHEAIDRTADGPLAGEDWILPDPGAHVARALPALAAAHAARQARVEQEALCGFYVAMTRAKRAMTIVCQPPPKTATAARRFSDFVRDALPPEIGDRAWYLAVPPPAAPRAARTEEEAPPARGPRARLARRLPSQAFHPGQSAGALFAGGGARAAAQARGTAAHAAFEAVEWIDPAAPQSDLERRILAGPFREAFVKPPDAAALWRERAFEIVADGRWTSGQFDRVVFTGAGDARAAAVYDFKTNAPRRGETAEAFAARMRETYTGQLAAYRAAVSALTGIPAARVRAVLLLAETDAAVEV